MKPFTHEATTFSRSDAQQWFRVTDWADPEDQIDSQWGLIRWTTWLYLEAGRRGVKGNACQIKTESGEQALFACYNSKWAWRDVDGEDN